MNQTLRKQIYQKYGAKCAYCGNKLPQRWYIDQIRTVEKEFYKNNKQKTTKDYNPVCSSCNKAKGSQSLESFRRTIANFINKLNNKIQYQLAKKYNLVEETDNKVIFYFESLNHNKNFPGLYDNNCKAGEDKPCFICESLQCNNCNFYEKEKQQIN